MGRNKKAGGKVTSDIKRKPMVVCYFCGKTEKETRFYRAKNPKYQYFEKITWCPECIKNEYERLLKKYESSEKAMYELCRFLDMFFSKKIFEIAKKRWEESGVEIYKGYITYYNSVGGKNCRINVFGK